MEAFRLAISGRTAALRGRTLERERFADYEVPRQLTGETMRGVVALGESLRLNPAERPHWSQCIRRI